VEIHLHGVVNSIYPKLKASAAELNQKLPPLARAQETPPAPARKRQIKKGMMYGSVPGSMPVLEKFKLIRQAGFEGVEVNSGMNQEEVLQARDATGLVIASVVDSVHWQESLADPNPAVRQAGLEGLTAALHDCKAYGASSVLLVPAVVNQQVSYDEAYRRSAAEIRKVTGLAEQLGVKIAIENVWNQFLLSPLEAARYVDEFHSPAVAWHFDVGNVINTAGRSNGFASWARASTNCTSRNTAARNGTRKGYGKDSKSSIWRGTTIGRR
jgi:L-ribulose-5-phosphate 3-epimerase